MSELSLTLGQLRPALERLERDPNAKEIDACYAVIGGLAVAFWQKHYFPEEKEIKSHDMDLRGGRSWADHLSKKTGISVKTVTHDGNKNFVTREVRWPLSRGLGQYIKVEFLERVHSLDYVKGTEQPLPTLQGIGMRMKYGTPHEINVLDPCSLLYAKYHTWRNRRNRTDKNDAKHLEVLAKVVPLFLEEAMPMFNAGKLQRNPAIAAKRVLKELEKCGNDMPANVLPHLPNLRNACEKWTTPDTPEIYN